MTLLNIVTTPSTALLTQAVDQLNAQNTDLEASLTSGAISDSYSGLGDQRFMALDLQPQITKIVGWQSNITSAQNILSVSQTAMSSVSSIATSLQTSLTTLTGDTSASTVAVAATQAQQALTQLATLLNTKDGSQYVFAGTDSNTAPVTDPATITSSAFFRNIASDVADVSTNGASQTEASTVAAAADNTAGQTVFSTALSVDPTVASGLNRRMTVGDQDHVSVGFVATQGTSAASTTSTGSSIRDLMRALAVVANLGQADTSSAQFSSLVASTRSQMDSVSSGLNIVMASMGTTQASLTSSSSMLDEVGDALTSQLGTIRDSDPTLLATQISATKTQLQASYSLIADMKGMSLAAYL